MPAPVRWMDAEPRRLEQELEAMAALAPDVKWIAVSPELPAGGWEGDIPKWPFDRDRPDPGLDLLVPDPLTLRVQMKQSFPASPPKLWPLLDPLPDPTYRTQTDWHINGDGSLCLLQTADMWTGRDPAANLVMKAAGWFIEYRLMEEKLAEKMTISGICADPILDDLIRGFGR
jgi:hypothetical protein